MGTHELAVKGTNIIGITDILMCLEPFKFIAMGAGY